MSYTKRCKIHHRTVLDASICYFLHYTVYCLKIFHAYCLP
nr:MAG TPA: hypothetical protein [Caudoviricetes sp.]